MTIVDNNVLSALAKIERLEFLREVFEDVATPIAVVDELRRAQAAGYEFVPRIESVTSHRDGWLDVVTPTETERRLADDIRDHALSTTDAQCLAIASARDRRLLTDDAHVGTIGGQRDVAVWDLLLFLKVAIRRDVITNAAELSSSIQDLRQRDDYRFSDADEESLFEEFER